ncbi:hypothetical protein PPERSA_10581 [Pseudocohnilembus persalinus]|uniref:Dolichyl-diphosphooligosaccharide--protein glycosyltransferase subunit OST2 n=1 Tax=Pseudocohnilembus persalinus TaxID=266149 RepID=A0A0V0Q9I9_PSEPJ|nr:hypothetical protein PPERSA_10581 [Pseudocohnilembus persalinus]|eukprot:KRW98810.1 hypothetical protein PPERSA_10581 [Pseudocohnilembus persalinus]
MSTIQQKGAKTKKSQKGEKGNKKDDQKILDEFIKEKQQIEKQIEGSFLENYLKENSRRVQLIDAFCLYLFSLAAVQIVYRVIAGDFPYNAFLAGIFSTFGLLIITVCLRMQVNPKTRYLKNQNLSTAFWEYLLCTYIFFVAIINYLG